MHRFAVLVSTGARTEYLLLPHVWSASFTHRVHIHFVLASETQHGSLTIMFVCLLKHVNYHYRHRAKVFRSPVSTHVKTSRSPKALGGVWGRSRLPKGSVERSVCECHILLKKFSNMYYVQRTISLASRLKTPSYAPVLFVLCHSMVHTFSATLFFVRIIFPRRRNCRGAGWPRNLCWTVFSTQRQIFGCLVCLPFFYFLISLILYHFIP